MIKPIPLYGVAVSSPIKCINIILKLIFKRGKYKLWTMTKSLEKPRKTAIRV